MKISGKDLQSIILAVPSKPTFRENYNNHIAKLQSEVKFLNEYSEIPEIRMIRSQSIAIKTMQIENAVKAFTL